MNLPVSYADIGVALTLVFIGSMTQASVGVGLAIISAPILMLLNPAFIPGPMLASAFALTVLIAFRERRSMDVSGLKWAIIGRILATAPAVAAVGLLSQSEFDIVFGIIVVSAVGASLLGVNLRPNPKTLFVAGTFSGLLGTLSGIGGPPMALVYQHSKGPQIRATLSAFFIFGTSLSMCALALAGHFGRQDLAIALVLLPGVVAGFWIAQWTTPYLDKRGLRAALLLLAFVSGVVVLIRGIA